MMMMMLIIIIIIIKWNIIEQTNPMEPRGDGGSVVVLHVY